MELYVGEEEPSEGWREMPKFNERNFYLMAKAWAFKQTLVYFINDQFPGWPGQIKKPVDALTYSIWPFKNTTCVALSLTRTRNNSVPAVGRIEVWGCPSTVVSQHLHDKMMAICLGQQCEKMSFTQELQGADQGMLQARLTSTTSNGVSRHRTIPAEIESLNKENFKVPHCNTSNTSQELNIMQAVCTQPSLAHCTSKVVQPGILQTHSLKIGGLCAAKPNADTIAKYKSDTASIHPSTCTDKPLFYRKRARSPNLSDFTTTFRSSGIEFPREKLMHLYQNKRNKSKLRRLVRCKVIGIINSTFGPNTQSSAFVMTNRKPAKTKRLSRCLAKLPKISRSEASSFSHSSTALHIFNDNANIILERSCNANNTSIGEHVVSLDDAPNKRCLSVSPKSNHQPQQLLTDPPKAELQSQWLLTHAREMAPQIKQLTTCTTESTLQSLKLVTPVVKCKRLSRQVHWLKQEVPVKPVVLSHKLIDKCKANIDSLQNHKKSEQIENDSIMSHFLSPKEDVQNCQGLTLTQTFASTNESPKFVRFTPKTTKHCHCSMPSKETYWIPCSHVLCRVCLLSKAKSNNQLQCPHCNRTFRNSNPVRVFF